MNINIMCKCYGKGGQCLHQAAPRRLFGAWCILEPGQKPTDPRIIHGCALQVLPEKPAMPPRKP